MKNKTAEEKPKNIWEEIAARALRTGANVPAVEVEFDREKSLSGLAWMWKKNRKPKETVINVFVNVLTSGDFAPGSQIRIAKNEDGEWVQIDGQHRLMAIARANAKAFMQVVVDIRPAKIAYANIDNVGTLRTDGDAVSSILGWNTRYWNSVVGAAKIINRKFHLVKEDGNTRTPDPEQISGLVQAYRKSIEATCEILGCDNAKGGMRAPIFSVLIVAARYQPEVFFPWISRAAADDMLHANSTEKKLIRLLQSSLAKTRDLTAPQVRERATMQTAMLWNAHYSGENINPVSVRLGVKRRTSWPGILGTPFGAE
jgi:hypothetical protein